MQLTGSATSQKLECEPTFAVDLSEDSCLCLQVSPVSTGLAYVAAHQLVFSSYTALQPALQQKSQQQRRFSALPGSSSQHSASQHHGQDGQPKSQKKILQGHEHAITCLASPGNRAVIATADAGPKHSQLILWDSATQQALCSVEQLHAGGVETMAMSNDGSCIATVGSTCTGAFMRLFCYHCSPMVRYRKHVSTPNEI